LIEAPYKGAKKITNLILSVNIHLHKKIKTALIRISYVAYLIFVVKYFVVLFLFYFKDFFGFFGTTN